MTSAELSRHPSTPHAAKSAKAPKASAAPVDNIRIVLPYPPSLNNMYPTSRAGRRFLSDEGKAFKKSAESVLFVSGRRWGCDLIPKGVQVRLTIDVYRPRRSGDLSNRIKAIEDVLKGWVYDDDGQVSELHVRRLYDKEKPRAEVLVERVAGGPR